MTTEEDITVELPAEETSAPRCADCFHEVMAAGPIPPTSADGARNASPETCLRGKGWSWCASQRRLSFEASPLQGGDG